jgi:hypothetical protein
VEKERGKRKKKKNEEKRESGGFRFGWRNPNSCSSSVGCISFKKGKWACVSVSTFAKNGSFEVSFRSD